ncbi:Uncharacterised protein [Dermatophilus congolensis]|uniref:Uncharacterized protein n=1 Tax=Dermatophilus congolensis TaxID=1863 RepID=A0AA46BPI2_9MICO|nr:Uncharacterised protein [Dermatophilus congolensis]
MLGGEYVWNRRLVDVSEARFACVGQVERASGLDGAQ